MRRPVGAAFVPAEPRSENTYRRFDFCPVQTQKSLLISAIRRLFSSRPVGAAFVLAEPRSSNASKTDLVIKVGESVILTISTGRLNWNSYDNSCSIRMDALRKHTRLPLCMIVVQLIESMRQPRFTHYFGYWRPHANDSNTLYLFFEPFLLMDLIQSFPSFQLPLFPHHNSRPFRTSYLFQEC